MYYRDLEKLGFNIRVRFRGCSAEQGTNLLIDIEFDSNSFFKHSLRDIKEDRFRILDTKIRDYFLSLDRDHIRYINSQKHQACLNSINDKAYYSGITPELKDFVIEVYNIIKEDIENGYKNKIQ